MLDGVGHDGDGDEDPSAQCLHNPTHAQSEGVDMLV